MSDVKLTHDEAECLMNHLEISILQEIKDDPDYDSMDYLVNLVNIYRKCRKEVDDNAKL